MDSKGAREIPGIMWQWDHERYLFREEYDYWMTHVLPWGWAIISEPLQAIGALANATEPTTKP